MASACILMICPITEMVLSVARKDDPNAFGLPGGKVEESVECRCVDYFGVSMDRCPHCRGKGIVAEKEIVAAVRELREETGIVLYDLLHWYPEVFRRDGGVTFLAKTSQIRDVLPVKETPRVAWITWQQLFDGPFGNYNRELAKAVGIK